MTYEGSSSSADRLTDELRQAILSREFAPGQRLTSAALAERFGVSQTPLREAFARLAGEGWLSYLPQRGVRVAQVSADEMLEIYELRELLEPMALERSVVAGDPAWRSMVEAAYGEMVALGGDDPANLDDERYDRYEHAHARFHQALVQECGSSWLIRLTEMLRDRSAGFRRLSLPLRRRMGSVQLEHEAILQGVLSGEATAAATAALAHMRSTRESIVEWIGEPAGD